MARAARRAGQILRRSYQSDPYRGSYKLVKSLGQGRWEIEELEPTEEEMQAILDDVEMARYRDPETEILERIDRAGTRKAIKLASAAEWHRYF